MAPPLERMGLEQYQQALPLGQSFQGLLNTFGSTVALQSGSLAKAYSMKELGRK